jgi:phage portal protein BeeE
MSFVDTLRTGLGWLALEEPKSDLQVRQERMMAIRGEKIETRAIDSFTTYPGLTEQLLAVQGLTSRPWRTPSIGEALGVPAIQSAVSLIASTIGMLSVQGFRNGALMDEAPKVIARPDPDFTPYEFYSGTGYCMASRGEFVWWIANRDSDGLASALVLVPPAELHVEENRKNRRRPVYTWGNLVSTRYSPANPEGQFVHKKYATAEPMALRGAGPLQLGQAATSVQVEAQGWAANFFIEDGGHPSILIKSATPLGESAWLGDPSDDPAVLLARREHEAEILLNAWMSKPHNTPRVVDPGIEDVKEFGANPQGAQMLEARQHGNGDAARMFRIPGSLLEYAVAGSSLTYQNLEGEFTKFVRTCLQPLYLEPIEQALSDLLPRSTAARFAVKGFLRADIKTRFEVHKTAIETGIYDAAYAQQEEGIIAGDVEYQPIPFAPPSAIPAPMQLRTAPTEIRCDGRRMLRGILTDCGKRLAPDWRGKCPRCKKEYPAVAA